MNRAASACRDALVDRPTAMQESSRRTGRDIHGEQQRMSSSDSIATHPSPN